MNKKELVSVGAVLVILGGLVAVWMYQRSTGTTIMGGQEQDEEEIVEQEPSCGTDRMLCSDGTAVFRTPPDCRFVCPNVSSEPVLAGNDGTLVIRIGETGKSSARSNVEINPSIILEDSRCPVDVTCIQAGTVRVQAKVNVNQNMTTTAFKLGEPVTVGGETITLVEVLPVKNTKKPVVYADYQFTFRISR